MPSRSPPDRSRRSLPEDAARHRALPRRNASPRHRRSRSPNGSQATRDQHALRTRRSTSPLNHDEPRRKRRRSSSRSDSVTRLPQRSQRFTSPPSTHKRHSPSRERRRDASRDRSNERYRRHSPSRHHRNEKRRPSRSRSRSRSPPRRRSRDRRPPDSIDYAKTADGKDSRRISRSPHYRRRSPNRRHSQSPAHRHRSRSKSPRRRTHRVDPPSEEPFRRRGPLPDQQQAFSTELHQQHGQSDVAPPVEKQKPNFGNTGLLAKEANKVAGTSISLKYHEPPDARKPPASAAWSLLVFKGDDHLQTIPLHERTCWLIGREQKVADITVEHPSCSGQHAVIQFRYTEKKTSTGEKKGKVRPYLIDLESRNKTFLDNEPIDEGRYVELRSGDVVKFGESTREYVLMLPPKD